MQLQFLALHIYLFTEQHVFITEETSYTRLLHLITELRQIQQLVDPRLTRHCSCEPHGKKYLTTMA